MLCTAVVALVGSDLDLCADGSPWGLVPISIALLWSSVRGSPWSRIQGLWIGRLPAPSPSDASGSNGVNSTTIVRPSRDWGVCCEPDEGGNAVKRSRARRRN